MEVKELSIGNLVMRNGVILQVEEIELSPSENGIEYLIHTDNGHHSINDIEGIEIDANLLKQVGFTRIGKKMAFGDAVNNIALLYYPAEGDGDSRDFWGVFLKTPIQKHRHTLGIVYFHELQNLFTLLNADLLQYK